MNGFFDNLLTFVDDAGTILQQAQQKNQPVYGSYNVPMPNTTDPYALNRYSNDVREQTPQYQAQQIEKLKSEQTKKLIAMAAGGLLIGALLFK